MDFFERNKDIGDIKMLSPLVWAYVGDAVYELFIRTYLVNNSNAKPHKLLEEEEIQKITILLKMQMLRIMHIALDLKL